MSLVLAEPARFLTREEYRQWYDGQPTGRYERVDGYVVKRSAERLGHVRAKVAVWSALKRAIAAGSVACEAFGDGVTVETGDGDFEPNAPVNCGPRLPDDAISAPTPVIIVEVLPPGTKSIDTGAKLTSYFQLESVAHYLIAHPSQRSIIHHRRTVDGITTAIVTQGSIEMNPPGITITLDEIYA